MAKGTRGRRRTSSRQFRATPYPLPLRKQDLSEFVGLKKCSKHLGKKDWEEATCSVCMEYPHNAVLLLCSSHDKGCRPYMCGTSFRYSNCLDQYKNAYTKVTQTQSSNAPANNSEVGPTSDLPMEICEVTELACPLCRGQVKGWTVFEPAREYLNAKTRSCMQDKCTFAGSFKELRRHVKSEHPSARPRVVDPDLERKWRSLERERERDDVISTIRSSMPGAMVFGDYVIERGHEIDSDEEEGFDLDVGETNGGFELGIDRHLLNVVLLLQAFGPGGNDQNRRLRRNERELDRALEGGTVGVRRSSSLGFDFADRENNSLDDGDDDDNGENEGMSLVHRLRRQGRVLLGRSGRRRRRREASSGGG